MCWLFHKWSKWGKLIEQTWIKGSNPFTYNPDAGEKFIRIAQERECIKCGLKQRRFIQK